MDDVIDPADTRAVLSRSLDLLRSKREELPSASTETCPCDRPAVIADTPSDDELAPSSPPSESWPGPVLSSSSAGPSPPPRGGSPDGGGPGPFPPDGTAPGSASRAVALELTTVADDEAVLFDGTAGRAPGGADAGHGATSTRASSSGPCPGRMASCCGGGHGQRPAFRRGRMRAHRRPGHRPGPHLGAGRGPVPGAHEPGRGGRDRRAGARRRGGQRGPDRAAAPASSTRPSSTATRTPSATACSG